MSPAFSGYLLIFLLFSNFAGFWLEPHLYLLAGLSILVKRLATEGEGAAQTPPPSCLNGERCGAASPDLLSCPQCHCRFSLESF
jgi:hypothetical protein